VGRLWLKRGKRRDIARAAFLQERDEFVVDRGIADSVCENVNARSRRYLRSVQRDRVGEDLDARAMSSSTIAERVARFIDVRSSARPYRQPSVKALMTSGL
jgi:hypothetical protein